MTIRMSKSILFIVCFWIIAAAVFIVFVFAIGFSKLTIFPVAGAAFSLFDAVVYFKFYKQSIFIKGDRISFYTGWLHGRVEYRLAEIVTVTYTKSAMIFSTHTEKRTLDVSFMSKDNEMKIYQYLSHGSVHIIYKPPRNGHNVA